MIILFSILSDITHPIIGLLQVVHYQDFYAGMELIFICKDFGKELGDEFVMDYSFIFGEDRASIDICHRVQYY